MDGAFFEADYLNYQKLFHQNGTRVMPDDTSLSIRAFLLEDSTRHAPLLKEIIQERQWASIPDNKIQWKGEVHARLLIIDGRDTMLLDFPYLNDTRWLPPWYACIFDSLVVHSGYYRYQLPDRANDSPAGIWPVVRHGLTSHTIPVMVGYQWLVVDSVVGPMAWLKPENQTAACLANTGREYLQARDSTRARDFLMRALPGIADVRRMKETIGLIQELCMAGLPDDSTIRVLSGYIDQDSLPAYFALRAFFQERAGRIETAAEDYTHWLRLCAYKNRLWEKDARLARARFYLRHQAFTVAARDYEALAAARLEYRPVALRPVEDAVLFFEWGKAEYLAGNKTKGLQQMAAAAEMGYHHPGSYADDRQHPLLLLCDSLLSVTPLNNQLYLIRGIAGYWYASSINHPGKMMTCYEQALADLILAEALGCREYRLYLFRAAIRRQLVHYDAAMNDASHAVRMCPEDPRGYEIRSQLWGNITRRAVKKAERDRQQCAALKRLHLHSFR